MSDPHPIYGVAKALFATGPNNDVIFRPEGKQELQRELRSYLEKPDLPQAVDELILLAMFFKTKAASPQTAEQIIEVIATAIPALQAKRGDALASNVEQKFNQMMGRTRKEAPMVGEDKPKKKDFIAPIIRC